jgi:hypothetical protein
VRAPLSGLKADNPSRVTAEAFVSYWGETDNNGAATGLTIRCGALANEPSYANHALKLLSGAAAGQVRNITLHPAGTDTLTVSAAFTDNTGAVVQVVTGTRFVVLSIPGGGGGGGAAPILYASGTQLAVVGVEATLGTAIAAGKFLLVVDKVNMAAGDILELRIYAHVLTGGVTRVAWFRNYYGAQSANDMIVISDTIPNDLAEADALRFTLLQTNGVGRNYPWKVLSI